MAVFLLEITIRKKKGRQESSGAQNRIVEAEKNIFISSKICMYKSPKVRQEAEENAFPNCYKCVKMG